MTYVLEQVQAAHLGHLQVTDHQIETAVRQLTERLGTVLGRTHRVPLHGQEVCQDIANEFFVVDDEDPWLIGGDWIHHMPRPSTPPRGRGVVTTSCACMKRRFRALMTACAKSGPRRDPVVR